MHNIRQISHWQAKLRDADWQTRWAAVQKIGRAPQGQTQTWLLPMLFDTNWIVRWEAADQLGARGDVSIVPDLIALLLGQTTYLRACVASCLGNLGDLRAVPPLMQVLADPNWFGRAHAALALGRLGDWRALPALLQARAEVEESLHDAAELAIKQMYATVRTVVFSDARFAGRIAGRKWHNPDAQVLQLPLSNLALIQVHAPTHNFHLVERFLTYALNEIGARHLKERVQVAIHGNAAALHQNLLNNFNYLCRTVRIYPEEPVTA